MTGAMSAFGPKQTCRSTQSKSLLGVLRTLGSSSANYAHKIGHFLDYLLPRKRRWEAHGKQIADGKKLLWVALARAERRDQSLVRYGMPRFWPKADIRIALAQLSRHNLLCVEDLFWP